LKKKNLFDFWAQSKPAILTLVLISSVINILYLTGSLFMLEVYDRVLPSRHLATLAGLCAIAATLFIFQGFLDFLRVRILTRVGLHLDQALHDRVYNIIVRMPVSARGSTDSLQPLRDLDQVRSFVSGAGPIALFDLPWMPFYLTICFIFHPLIGLVTLCGGLLLLSFTLATDVMLRSPSRAGSLHSGRRNALLEAARRSVEAVQSMGMMDRLGIRWKHANDDYLESQRIASDIGGGFSSASKILRMMLQSAVLAIGAYLVINQEASAGIMIASSILTSRALAPVELALAHWKSFVAARQSLERLNSLLGVADIGQERTALPAPRSALSVEGALWAAPGMERPVLHDICFTLEAGSALGIVGPSASGKSSLVRLLVGVVRPTRGKIRLDGASLDQWHDVGLGDHIGYLPQDVDLLPGTVAENISRFTSNVSSERLLKAAQAAGVHDLILRFTDGYDTRLGEGGLVLSVGQRQRIALARALYGNPFLIVLDEPNSNLDMDGEKALTEAIQNVRERGGVAVVVAHRPSALAACNLIMMMNDGKVTAFGPKDEVLGQILRYPVHSSANASAPGIKIVDKAGAAE
jgi:ATP-binding cassette subfamily C protein